MNQPNTKDFAEVEIDHSNAAGMTETDTVEKSVSHSNVMSHPRFATKHYARQELETTHQPHSPEKSYADRPIGVPQFDKQKEFGGGGNGGSGGGVGSNKRTGSRFNSVALFLAVAIVIWVLSLCYALFAYQPKYASKSSVLIKDSAITAKYITSDNYSTTSSSASNPVLNTMELLKSKQIRQDLWTAFLQKYPNELERLEIENEADWAAYFGNGSGFIKYKNIPGTDVIYLTFKWGDPALAQKGMETLLTALQDASRRLNQREHRERSEFLMAQSDDIEKDLKTVRETIRNFKEKNQTYDIEKEIENYAKNQVEFETEIMAAQADAQGLQHQLSAYQKSLGMTSGQAMAAVALGRNQNLSKLQNKLYGLSEQYASLRSKYTPKHRKVKEVGAQIEQTKADIQEEITRSGVQDPSAIKSSQVISDETRGDAVRDMLAVESKYRAQQMKANALQGSLNRLRTKMQKLPQAEEALSSLKEEETDLSESLTTLRQKALEAKLREAQTLSNVFVIDQASLPKAPNFPTQLHIIIIGLVMGLIAGLAAVVLRQKISDSTLWSAFAQLE